MRMIYPCRLEADPGGDGVAGGFIATFPDVPEAVTAGETEAEALANAADALTVALLGRIKDGTEIPRPSRHAKTRPVALDAAAAAKLALYDAWRDSGLSKVAFAGRLGVAEGEVRRMLNPYHATRIERLEQALRTLGKRLVVSVEAA